ncbi:DUF2877 domain-containing protein [[Eubacterium] cellulosolvens]
MPITLRANCIGSLASKALSSRNYETVGEVVNTFSNSFYLKTVKGELVFVTNRPLRSPITINLDTTSNLEDVVKPMERVYVDEKEIWIGADASIDLRGALSYQARSHPASELNPQFARMREALRTVAFLLGIIDTGQSVLDPHGLTHDGTVDFVSDGVMPLRGSRVDERFRQPALKIVGLGSGFTPSGDDALGGFLATYNALAKTVDRAPILLDFSLLLRKTTWISAKLLDHMQHLILDDEMHHVIDSATTADQDDVVLALEALLPRGHTSGIDIAVGAVLALSLIGDIAFEKKETEIIVSALGLSR